MTAQKTGRRLGAVLLTLAMLLSLLPTAALAADYELTAKDNGNGTWSSPSATLKVGDTATLKGYTSSYADTHDWTSSNPDAVSVTSFDGATATIRVNATASETVTVTDTYSGSWISGGSIQFKITVADPDSGAQSIIIVKTWSDGAENHTGDTVTAGVYNPAGKRVKTATLNSANNWTATVDSLGDGVKYTVKEDSVTNNAGTDISGQYTAAVTDSSKTSTVPAAWTALEYGNVEDGGTYAFVYTDGGADYLLGRDGTSVIGSTRGIVNGAPSGTIGDDFLWEVSIAMSYGSKSSYGDWYLKNKAANSYIYLSGDSYRGYSVSLSSSASGYYNALFLDGDGSVWNQYVSGNIFATGASVGADGDNFTEFTPYVYQPETSVTTTTYTIANTKTAAPEPVSYTVTFDSDGGSTIEVQTVQENQTASEPAAPVKDGYTFDGWYNGDSKFNFSTQITGNITLTAKWTANPPAVVTYTVTWQNADGTTLKTDTVESGAVPSYNGATPAKANDDDNTYVFAGWNPEPAAITENTVYTATFTAVSKAELNATNAVQVVDLTWSQFVVVQFAEGYSLNNISLAVDGVDVTDAFTPVTDDGSVVKWELEYLNPGTLTATEKDTGRSKTVEITKTGTGNYNGLSKPEGKTNTSPGYMIAHGPMAIWDYYLTNYDAEGNVRTNPAKTTFDINGTSAASKIPAYWSPNTILDAGDERGTVKILFNDDADWEKAWLDGVQANAAGTVQLVGYDENQYTSNAALNFTLTRKVEHGTNADGSAHYVAELNVPFGQNNFRNVGRYYIRVKSSSGGAALVPVHIMAHDAPTLSLSGSGTIVSGQNLSFQITGMVNGIKNPTRSAELKKPDHSVEQLTMINDWYQIGDKIFLYNYADENTKGITNHIEQAGEYTLTVHSDGYQDMSVTFHVSAENSGQANLMSAVQGLWHTMTQRHVDAGTGATYSVSSSESGEGGGGQQVSADVLFDADLLINAMILERIDITHETAKAIVDRWEGMAGWDTVSARDTTLGGFDWSAYITAVSKARTAEKYLSFAQFAENDPLAEKTTIAHSVKSVLEDNLLGDIQFNGDWIGKDAPELTLMEQTSDGSWNTTAHVRTGDAISLFAFGEDAQTYMTALVNTGSVNLNGNSKDLDHKTDYTVYTTQTAGTPASYLRIEPKTQNLVEGQENILLLRAKGYKANTLRISYGPVLDTVTVSTDAETYDKDAETVTLIISGGSTDHFLSHVYELAVTNTETQAVKRVGKRGYFSSTQYFAVDADSAQIVIYTDGSLFTAPGTYKISLSAQYYNAVETSEFSVTGPLLAVPNPDPEGSVQKDETYDVNHYFLNFGANDKDSGLSEWKAKISAVTVNGTAYTEKTGFGTSLSYSEYQWPIQSENDLVLELMGSRGFQSSQVNTVVIQAAGYEDLTVHVNGSDGALYAPVEIAEKSGAAEGTKAYTITPAEGEGEAYDVTVSGSDALSVDQFDVAAIVRALAGENKTSADAHSVKLSMRTEKQESAAEDTVIFDIHPAAVVGDTEADISDKLADGAKFTVTVARSEITDAAHEITSIIHTHGNGSSETISKAQITDNGTNVSFEVSSFSQFAFKLAETTEPGTLSVVLADPAKASDYAPGDTFTLTVAVSGGKFYAGELEISYDKDRFTLTDADLTAAATPDGSHSSIGGPGKVGFTEGIVPVSIYTMNGIEADTPVAELHFQVNEGSDKGNSAVSVTKADLSDTYRTDGLNPVTAAKKAITVTVTDPPAAAWQVTLSGAGATLTGKATATTDVSYTAQIGGYDTGKHDYEISVQIGGNDAVYTLSNTGLITIDVAQITGDITITVTASAIQFDVYVNGTKTGTVNSGADYDGTIEGYALDIDKKYSAYTVSYTMGKSAERTAAVKAGKYAIPNVTGELKITVTPVFKTHTVTLEADNLLSTADVTAVYGKDYTAQIDNYDTSAFAYTVKAERVGEEISCTVSEQGLITISGELILGDLKITVTADPVFEVEVYRDYVSGWYLAVVYGKAQNGYRINQKAMFRDSYYDDSETGKTAYAYLLDNIPGADKGSTTSTDDALAEAVRDLITAGTERTVINVVPVLRYDVNGSGEVNFTDRYDVFRGYNKGIESVLWPNDDSVRDNMAHYLALDVNGDHLADLQDLAEIQDS